MAQFSMKWQCRKAEKYALSEKSIQNYSWSNFFLCNDDDTAQIYGNDIDFLKQNSAEFRQK